MDLSRDEGRNLNHDLLHVLLRCSGLVNSWEGWTLLRGLNMGGWNLAAVLLLILISLLVLSLYPVLL